MITRVKLSAQAQVALIAILACATILTRIELKLAAVVDPLFTLRSSVAWVAATSGAHAIQAIVTFTVTAAIFIQTWRNYLGLFTEVSLAIFWTVTLETTVPLKTGLSI